MEMKPGTRLRSTVCSTEVVVVRAPRAEVDLRCGGRPMAAVEPEPVVTTSIDAAHHAGTLIGKRYADPGVGIEVLATRGGEGSLSLGDQPMTFADAKALPSSD